MIRQRKAHRNQGFTLIELMITIGILGIAIIPMMSVYVSTWQATIQAKRRNHATMLARQQMSMLKGKKPYNALTGTFSNSFKAPYNKYKYTIKVKNLASGANAVYQAKLLKTRVTYQSVYGGRRSLSCPESTNCSQWDYTQIISPTGK